MRLGIVVQCRFNSKRYKGKILKKINHLTILEILIERLRFSKLADDICLAIADTEDDLKIVNLAKKLNINYFVGSEKNVLSRHYHAAKKMNYDHIMRVTSDCPLIDPKIIDKMISKYLRLKNIDFLSNTHPPTFPDGFDVEIFKFSALQKAFKNAKKNYEKEHVTPFIWDNPKNFELSNYKLKNDDLYEKYRLTLDYKEDFFVIWSIFNKLYKKKKFFELKHILDYLKKNPNILKNNHFIKVNWYMNYHKSLKTINKKYYKKN